MTLDPSLRAMMNQTASVAKYSRVGQEGGITYSTAKNYPCYREYRQHLTTDQSGQDVTATSCIYVGPSSSGGFPQLTTRDRITVSSSSPRIINAERFVDEFGAAYVEVAHCG